MTLDAKRRRRMLEASVFGAATARDTGILFDGEDDNSGSENSDEMSSSPALHEQPEGKAAFDQMGETKQAAWHDSDDENLQVDVTGGKKRLRKLRRADHEHVLDGKTYESRLREQFRKQLGGGDNVPDWAKEQEVSSDEEDSEAEDVVDEEKNELDRERAPRKAAAAEPASVVDMGKVLARKKTGMFSTRREKKAELKRQRTPAAESRLLPPTELQIAKLRDANKAEGMNCIAECIEFHANSEMFLTAGKDKTLRLFSVDGEENPKLASYHFAKYPITSASFHAGHNSVYLTGKTHTLYKVDLDSGKTQLLAPFRGFARSQKGDRPGTLWNLNLGCNAAYNAESTSTNGGFNGNLASVCSEKGKVCLIDLRTASCVRTLTMNNAARQAVWHPTVPNELISADEKGHIYRWNVGTGRCVDSWSNENCIGVSSLDCVKVGDGNANGRIELAVGTMSGTVDVFDITNPDAWGQTSSSSGGSAPPILKTYDQLQTDITCVKYNPSGEILGFASKLTRKACRLAHTGTKTVFANWPTGGVPFKYAESIAFSRKHGYVATGQADGRVMLFQLEHYAAS
eukprot:g13428.t1